jgi:hypothetical protein
MKTFLACIAAAAVLLAGVTPCFAGFLESQMIIEPDRTYVIRGAFKQEQPGSAFPTESIFSYEIQTSTSNVHEKFYFSGQKGDDAFEIKHTWAKFGGLVSVSTVIRETVTAEDKTLRRRYRLA